MNTRDVIRVITYQYTFLFFYCIIYKLKRWIKGIDYRSSEIDHEKIGNLRDVIVRLQFILNLEQLIFARYHDLKCRVENRTKIYHNIYHMSISDFVRQTTKIRVSDFPLFPGTWS